MTLSRSTIVILGVVLWVGVILLFNRFDLGFLLASAMFALMITFLTLSEKKPEFAKIKLNVDDDPHE